MAVTGIGTYASYTNSYGNTQNAGNKMGRTYKNAHEYKNYLTQKYDCLRSRDYSVNINSSLLSKAMGDEKTKQWLEYNLSLIPKTIEQPISEWFKEQWEKLQQHLRNSVQKEQKSKGFRM